jgi:GNAT superfamily N-acetyltransferase
MRPLPDGVTVKRAAVPDAPRVRALVEEGILSYRAWAPHLTLEEPPPDVIRRIEARFDDQDTWILIALAGDKPAGVVSLSRETAAHPEPAPPGMIYLWQLFVRPQWQGTGLAQALIDLAFHEAQQRGFARISLWAAAGASQARRFYEKEGFRPSGATQHDEHLNLDLVEYERAIE